MPAIEEISESLIRENITRAVGDVFKTMMGRAIVLDPAEASPNDPAASAPQVIGTVGFIGDINGLVYLYINEDFANQCTAQILGMNAFELKTKGDEVVNDAIGELTNMVVSSPMASLTTSSPFVFSSKAFIPRIWAVHWLAKSSVR